MAKVQQKNEKKATVKKRRAFSWSWADYGFFFLMCIVMDSMKELSDYWLTSGRAIGSLWIIDLFYLGWVLIGGVFGAMICYGIVKNRENKQSA